MQVVGGQVAPVLRMTVTADLQCSARLSTSECILKDYNQIVTNDMIIFTDRYSFTVILG